MKMPSKIWVVANKMYTSVDYKQWYLELSRAFSSYADVEDYLYDEGLEGIRNDVVIACYQLAQEPKKKSVRKAAKRNARKRKKR
jgi:hypothetical protein